MRKVFLMMLLWVVGVAACHAKDVEVTGEATYYDDGRHSRIECMQLALEQARVNALAKEFGTVVTQDIIQSDRVSNGKETNDFLALSSTEVKGEWLGDVGEPKYDYSYDANQNLIVTCRVKGKARAVSNQAASFETAALKNGMFRNNESSSYNDGDQMYLYFLGASDGYVMVFLEDESRKVYNLLPYRRDSKGEVKVKKFQEYIFFSREKGNREFGPEEELLLTAPNHPEFNKLYVVFSPNQFSLPVMKNPGELPELTSDAFSKWYLKARRNDPSMAMKVINLQISPRQ